MSLKYPANGNKPNQVVIYTKSYCPYCDKAKNLFKQKGIAYNEVNIETDHRLMMEVVVKSGGRKTVPQIFINDQHIGGCDDLYALEQEKKLDEVLKSK